MIFWRIFDSVTSGTIILNAVCTSGHIITILRNRVKRKFHEILERNVRSPLPDSFPQGGKMTLNRPRNLQNSHSFRMRAAAIVTNLESLTWPSDDENDNNDEESKKE